MIKVVSFDWDGTLANTQLGALVVANHILEERGLPAVDREFFATISHAGTEYLIAACAKVPCPTKESKELQKEFDGEYLNYPDYELFSHVKETIAELKQRGIKIAVSTNKTPDILHKQMQLKGIESDFDLILCDDGTVPLKPDPTMVNKLLEHFNCESHEILFVGDAVTDMEAGRKGGAIIVYCNFGFGDISKTPYPPDYRIDDMLEILDIINKLS